MKKLLIIISLVHFSTYAQTEPKFDKDGNLIIPKEQIQNVFTGLKQNDICQSYVIKLEQSVTELANELLTIQTVYNDGQQKLKALESERDGLIDESEKLMVDLAVLKATKPKWHNNRWLWMGIGAASGIYIVKQF